MAIWIKLPSVTMTNGSNTVSVTGSIDLSSVKAGWALIINGNYVEIASGTAADSNGKSTLTLANAWSGKLVRVISPVLPDDGGWNFLGAGNGGIGN